MAAYHKERYRNDPEWRAKVIAATKAYQQRNANDPEFQKLRYLDKTIYQLRQRMEDHQRKAEEFEKRLMKATRDRERIRARRYAK